MRVARLGSLPGRSNRQGRSTLLDPRLTEAIPSSYDYQTGVNANLGSLASCHIEELASTPYNNVAMKSGALHMRFVRGVYSSAWIPDTSKQQQQVQRAARLVFN